MNMEVYTIFDLRKIKSRHHLHRISILELLMTKYKHIIVSVYRNTINAFVLLLLCPACPACWQTGVPMLYYDRK